jgi:hypothetical protein
MMGRGDARNMLGFHNRIKLGLLVRLVGYLKRKLYLFMPISLFAYFKPPLWTNFVPSL